MLHHEQKHRYENSSSQFIVWVLNTVSEILQ